MPRARVFISHSTKAELSPAEESAREVLEALTRALDAEDRYHVLLDRVSLHPGDAWRARINLWVGACDAAVVLISQAALQSAYVAYETSILSYRRTVDASLRVIPVLVPPVTPDALQGSRLDPQQLDELQLIHGGGTAQIVERVLAALRDAEYAPSPVERRAGHLADVLKEADEDDVRAASDGLGLDAGPWLPSEDPVAARHRRLRLAVQLLSVGMEGATEAISILQQRMRDDADVRRMIDLVASSWVDYRSTTRIPLIARDPDGPRAFGVNAHSTDTAWMYMRCAASNDPLSHKRGVVDSWFLVPTTGIAGEHVVDDLEQEIRRGLLNALRVPEDRLKRVLETLFAWKPVLVALPHTPSLTHEVLAELRQRLPRVIFFLLTGGEPGAGALRDAEVEFLVPALGEGDEDAFLEAYDTLKDMILINPAPWDR